MAAVAKLIAKYEIRKQKLNKSIQNCTKKTNWRKWLRVVGVSIEVMCVAGGDAAAAETERQKDGITRHQQLLSSASHALNK